MDPNNPKEGMLQLLIEKYMANRCSKDELEVLIALAKDETEELAEALQSQWSLIGEANTESKHHWDDLFHTMMQKAEEAVLVIPLTPGLREFSGTRFRREKKGWIIRAALVAAIMVAVFLVSVSILNRNGDSGTKVVQKSNGIPGNDIAPGRDIAILTLADGRQIILDTATDGDIARQGGIKVIKKGDQIMYDDGGQSTQTLYNNIMTPKGGQYQLILPDGSRVWLNAASNLKYPTVFNGADRTVELTGEAYFEIAHHPGKPFRVQTNQQVVEVLGTHFNINSYPEETSTKTTLLQGSVKVSVRQSSLSSVLRPGEQSSLSDNGLKVDKADISEAIAWKEGLFRFNGERIESIMRQLSRWYNIEVNYEGKVSDEVFYGRVNRNMQIGEVLRILERSHKVSFKIEGRRVTVVSKT
jgi:transmembrane sensor